METVVTEEVSRWKHHTAYNNNALGKIPTYFLSVLLIVLFLTGCGWEYVLNHKQSAASYRLKITGSSVSEARAVLLEAFR